MIRTIAILLCLAGIFYSIDTGFGNGTGLYFMLQNKTYWDGDSLLISDIGTTPSNQSVPGSALICVTSNVNTNCCRNIDSKRGRVGRWLFPNNSEVPRRADNNFSFVKTAYKEQVKLSRHPNKPAGPPGVYRCEVPLENSDRNISASITLNTSTGLYFMLQNKIYWDGDSLLISDIGTTPSNQSVPGSALICVTSNVNTNCCRGIDTKRDPVGRWLFPNNSEVPCQADNPFSFAKTAYIEQVKLSRHPNKPAGPPGVYRCEVPLENNETNISASITLKTNIILTSYSTVYTSDDSSSDVRLFNVTFIAAIATIAITVIGIIVVIVFLIVRRKIKKRHSFHLSPTETFSTAVACESLQQDSKIGLQTIASSDLQDVEDPHMYDRVDNCNDKSNVVRISANHFEITEKLTGQIVDEEIPNMHSVIDDSRCKEAPNGREDKSDLYAMVDKTKKEGEKCLKSNTDMSEMYAVVNKAKMKEENVDEIHTTISEAYALVDKSKQTKSKSNDKPSNVSDVYAVVKKKKKKNKKS